MNEEPRPVEGWTLEAIKEREAELFNAVEDEADESFLEEWFLDSIAVDGFGELY